MYRNSERFCENIKTITWVNKEKTEVRVGDKIRKVVWDVKEKVYYRTNSGSSRFR